MKKLLLFVLMISIGLFASDEQLVIKGSTTVLPIAQACAEIYMDNNPDSDITIMGGGSGVGIASLIDGTTDIANASRAIKSKELATARANGRKPEAHIVALDGIAIITHKDLPIKDLTLKQVRDIFTKKIKNWKELGGPSKAIVLVSRDVSSGTFEVFKEKVLDGATVSNEALKVASNQSALTTITDTPFSIGYVGFGYLNSNVNAPKVNGVEATKANAIAEKFPIVRPLFMYTNGTPKGATKDFLDFVFSNEGQALVTELGYIPVK